MGNNTVSGVFIRERRRKFRHRGSEETDRQEEAMTGVPGDWSDVSTSQGAPKIAGHARHWREA